MNFVVPMWARWGLVILGALLLFKAVQNGIARWEAGKVNEGIEAQAGLTREATAKAKADDAAKVIAVERKQGEISKEKSNDYENDLDSIRSRYRSERLRAEAEAYRRGQRDAAVPGLSSAAGRFDAAAGKAGLVAESADTAGSALALNLNEREAAEKQAWQLLRLQQWVHDQGELAMAAAEPAPAE